MIQEFQTYLLAIKGYSTHTAKAYRKDLKAFATWVKETRDGGRWSTITRADIDEYIKYMYNQHKAPATISRHLSSINALYKYAIRQGWMTENPARYESRPKLAKRQPNTIPLNDIVRAMVSSTPAVAAMLATLSNTGIRIQEMLNIHVSDINQERRTIRIHGKGAKDRTVYITGTLATMLHDLGVGRTGRIFEGFDQRTARHAIWTALQQAGSHAEQQSPHAIRHTYATEAAAHGANVTTLAAILGHEDIRTTQKYIDMAQIDVKEAMQQYTIIN